MGIDWTSLTAVTGMGTNDRRPSETNEVAAAALQNTSRGEPTANCNSKSLFSGQGRGGSFVGVIPVLDEVYDHESCTGRQSTTLLLTVAFARR